MEQEAKSDRRGRTKGRLDQNEENKHEEKMYSPSSHMVTKQIHNVVRWKGEKAERANRLTDWQIDRLTDWQNK